MIVTCPISSVCRFLWGRRVRTLTVKATSSTQMLNEGDNITRSRVRQPSNIPRPGTCSSSPHFASITTVTTAFLVEFSVAEPVVWEPLEDLVRYLAAYRDHVKGSSDQVTPYFLDTGPTRGRDYITCSRVRQPSNIPRPGTCSSSPHFASITTVTTAFLVEFSVAEPVVWEPLEDLVRYLAAYRDHVKGSSDQVTPYFLDTGPTRGRDYNV
ncbi:hypothetical protein J6590_017715 [Homalodisca vitripennis]|nr:hypothetical protein J6590_017715 [Homalodisca vitripennis]